LLWDNQSKTSLNLIDMIQLDISESSLANDKTPSSRTLIDWGMIGYGDVLTIKFINEYKFQFTRGSFSDITTILLIKIFYSCQNIRKYGSCIWKQCALGGTCILSPKTKTFRFAILTVSTFKKHVNYHNKVHR
jgi:hypothetical protein